MQPQRDFAIPVSIVSDRDA